MGLFRRRQLLAVMFTDIVGYSAMVNRDERRARELLDLQRRTVQQHVMLYEGRMIETIGDGCLVTFPSARAALECAIAVQATLLQRNTEATADGQLRLRIGVHIGDVDHEHGKVFGDGVNVAARLEPLSPHGGLCGSAEAIAQLHGPLHGCFRAHGPVELKNIPGPRNVFIIDEGTVAAAARLLPPQRNAARRLRRAAPALAAGLAGLALLMAGLHWWRNAAPDALEDASVAILPLTNLSSGLENDEFVAGLHDSLLTEVSRLPQLKVISRTLVMRYATNPPPIPTIGRELNVAYVLEGSVQRNAGRLRINVQLIRARSDHHIWARTYDVAAADLWDIQTQIAREIGQNTQGRLVMDALPVAKRPTRSVDAYEMYLRAISLEDNDPNLGREPPRVQIALLERAIALDPEFGLAQAALARYNIWAANSTSYLDPAATPAYLDAAQHAAQRAIELAPNAAETLVAKGLVRYWQGDDGNLVAADFEAALAVRPGYPLALFWLGSVNDRLGKTDQAMVALQSLRRIDPYNERVYTLLAQMMLNRRQYTELEKTYAQWRTISSAPQFVDYWATQLAFLAKGDLQPWKQFASRNVHEGLARADIDAALWEIAMYERRFDDAAALGRHIADRFLEGQAPILNSVLGTGLALAAAGRQAEAGRYLEKTVAYLEEQRTRNPQDSLLLTSLALCQRALGQESSALKSAREAVTLSEPVAGSPPLPGHYNAVLVYAQTLAHFGHKAEALKNLEWLFRQPSATHAHVVRRDPMWMPLDQDPDFQALVAQYLPR